MCPQILKGWSQRSSAEFRKTSVWLLSTKPRLAATPENSLVSNTWAAPVAILTRLVQYRVLSKEGGRLQLAQRVVRQELVQRWSPEATNACCADGWRRADVISAVAAAMSEKRDEFDGLVHSERSPEPCLWKQ